MLHVFCMLPMQNTCKVQGAFNKNLKHACFFDFSDGCINIKYFCKEFSTLQPPPPPPINRQEASTSFVLFVWLTCREETMHWCPV